MELRVLRYFLAIARAESISAAAQTLHITQPTLSRQMMELEQELGVTLLLRGKRNYKITLTDAGMLLRSRAEEIVLLADRAEAEFKASDTIISGDISIGGAETDAMRLVARTAKALQHEHPQICYHIFSGNANDVAERLDKGLLDFGLFIEPANIEKYDYIRLPLSDTWGLLLQKDSLLAQQDAITPQDLRGLSLLVSRQSMVRNELSGWCGYDFETLNIIATYNLIYNAALMVDEGFGVALCLDKLVNTTGESRLCFRPLQPPLTTQLCVAWKKHQLLSKAAKKFLDALQVQIYTMG